MELFLKTLLSLSLAGSVLGLIVMFLSRLGKKRLSSSFVYLCWTLVILRFALPLPGLIGLSIESTRPAKQSVAATDIGANYYVSPISRTEGTLTRKSASDNVRKALDSGYSASDGLIITGSTIQTEPSARDSASSGTNVKYALYRDWNFWFYVWLGGALISFGGTVFSFGRFRRILFRTLKPARLMDSSVLSALNASPYPALYRSDKVSSTVLLGLIRPVIVLPDRAYTSDDLDRILKHELTHYRRGDLAVKWLQTLIFSAHWFNPLVYLFRTQTTLYCELSCDQTLIKRMDRDDKQSYGELLLNLAADRALPRRVIAVSFTTQKRDLKERLVQIMTFKKLGKKALALGLAALMMIVGCAFVLGPAMASSAGTGEKVSEQAYETIRVGTVDEFLDAIGSNRTILLAPGEYDLSKASDYGRSQSSEYYWERQYDGYTLVIDVARNLTIAGDGAADEVSIITRPRSVAVIKLVGASNVTLKNLTAGHTVLPDACQGAVVELYACRAVTVEGCVLYGCGTLGIQANECWQLRCANTVIKECSVGAMEVSNSYDVTFDQCEFHDCHASGGYPGLWLIFADNTTDLGVYNTDIYSNNVRFFVESSNSNGLEIIGCRVHDNSFETGFDVYGDNVTVALSEFASNGLDANSMFTGEHRFVQGIESERLDYAALENMQWAEYSVPERTEEDTAALEGKLLADGRMEYHVSDVDELLACLGSDRVIYLDGDRFELSAAANYGKRGGAGYYWTQCYDGYGLVLIGVKDMTLIGKETKTNVELMPRSADVMAFKYCSDITLENLVLGHIKGAGGCTGDVVSFMGCNTCDVNNCELYGCGVNGLNAFASMDIHVNDSEIYECSGFAAVVSDCSGTELNNVIIRDCGYNAIETQRCQVKFSGTSYYSEGFEPSWYADYGYSYDEYDYDGDYDYDASYDYDDDYGAEINYDSSEEALSMELPAPEEATDQ